MIFFGKNNYKHTNIIHTLNIERYFIGYPVVVVVIVIVIITSATKRIVRGHIIIIVIIGHGDKWIGSLTRKNTIIVTKIGYESNN